MGLWKCRYKSMKNGSMGNGGMRNGSMGDWSMRNGSIGNMSVGNGSMGNGSMGNEGMGNWSMRNGSMGNRSMGNRSLSCQVQRKALLSVALDHGMRSLLRDCAFTWSSGGTCTSDYQLHHHYVILYFPL